MYSENIEKNFVCVYVWVHVCVGAVVFSCFDLTDEASLSGDLVSH